MKQRLIKLLGQFKNKKILIVGDIMLDKYIWGDVSRISPEAPVQVVNVVRETYEAGGAANVANNISSLGAKAFMVGIAGEDEAKNILLNELKKRNIDTKGIFTDKDKPTTQKIRIVGKSQQLLRVDYEKKEHIHKYIEESILQFLSAIITQIDVVVISDYAKGVLTANICKNLIEISKSHDKKIVVDPKPEHMNFYSNVSLITPNNLEASQMSDIEDGSNESAMEMGKKLMRFLNANVLITQGEKGMSLFEKDGAVSHIPAKAKEVYSLIGAGDTVVATLSLALASGASMKEAAVLSNIAAGIKVGKIGTATVSIEEIKKELQIK